MPSIESLPSEMLTAIFRMGAVPDPSLDWSHIEYVMSVAQTSKQWRQVALADSSLWRTISIYVFDSREVRLALLRLFVDRSGTCTVDISIDATWDYRERREFKGDLRPQLAIVMPLVSRWRSVSVAGSFHQDVVDICAPFQWLYTPRLESFELVIDSEEDDYDYEAERLDLFLGGAPKLTRIKIDGAPITSYRPPLSSLTSLYLHESPQSLSHNQYRDILVASPFLTDLHIRGDFVGPEQLFSDVIFNKVQPFILLPSLKSLKLQPLSFTRYGWYTMLASLETPALECLTVYSPSVSHILALEAAFRETHGQSRYPLLQSLSLRYANCDEFGDWIFILFPAITHVSLRQCESPGTLLGRLLPGSSEPPDGPLVWPLLRIIGLSVTRTSELDSLLEVLYAVISNRISRGSPITCLRLTTFTAVEIPTDKMEWLRNNVCVEVGALE